MNLTKTNRKRNITDLYGCGWRCTPYQRVAGILPVIRGRDTLGTKWYVAHTHLLILGLILLVLGSVAVAAPQKPNRPSGDQKIRYLLDYDFVPLRLAVEDLIETFGSKYPDGREYLSRLDQLKAARAAAVSLGRNSEAGQAELQRLARELPKLQYDSLLSNPLLDFDELILLKRKRGQLGLPVNHKCNTGIERTGYDNEIAA
ncbi:MAG: hypothetical protein JSW47_22805, partial [Phycisphaerales bacterium]